MSNGKPKERPKKKALLEGLDRGAAQDATKVAGRGGKGRFPLDRPPAEERPRIEPDAQEPAVYPSQMMGTLRQTGLMRDTVGPVMGYPTSLQTPDYVMTNKVRTKYLAGSEQADTVKVYNVRDTPSKHVNTTVHEMAHANVTRSEDKGEWPDVPTYWSESEEFSARHATYGLQYIRLMNKGMGKDQAMSVVQARAGDNIGGEFSQQHVQKMADWWKKEIPSPEQRRRQRRAYASGRGSQWSGIQRTTEEARRGHAAGQTAQEAGP